jgi:hypothetical protein
VQQLSVLAPQFDRPSPVVEQLAGFAEHLPETQ